MVIFSFLRRRLTGRVDAVKPKPDGVLSGRVTKAKPVVKATKKINEEHPEPEHLTKVYEGDRESSPSSYSPSPSGINPSPASTCTSLSHACTPSIDESEQDPAKKSSPVVFEHVSESEPEPAPGNRHLVTPGTPRFASWTQAEADLFNKLNMRGFEPLLPRAWHLDFPTMPDELWTDDDAQAFIKSVNPDVGSSNNKASRALGDLLQLGAVVRDRLAIRQRPDSAIRRTLRAYERWSHNDADLANHAIIPALVITSGTARQSTRYVVDKARKALRAHAAAYRAAWRPAPTSPFPDAADEGAPRHARPLPTLYGLVIAHTIVAVVTFDADAAAAADEGADLRTLAVFDLGDEGQDVWNAFALAIVVVTARDRLLEMRAPRLWRSIEADSDPDA